jgi:hypothetical protein
MLYQMSGYTYLEDLQDILHIYPQSGKSLNPAHRGSDSQQKQGDFHENS